MIIRVDLDDAWFSAIEGKTGLDRNSVLNQALMFFGAAVNAKENGKEIVTVDAPDNLDGVLTTIGLRNVKPIGHSLQ